MSPDTRWMSSIAAPTSAPAVKTTSAAAGSAPAAPPVEAPRPVASALPAAAAQPATRSARAAAIRARTWQAAWLLALRHPRVETFEGLAANPSGSLARALRWCAAGFAVSYALPALFSLVRGGASWPALLFAFGLLVVVSLAALAAGAAVACGAAAHLAAYGLQPRPHLLERQASPAPTAGVFQKAVYVRLAFACAAFAAPLSVALGVALVMPDLLRGLLLFGLSVWAGGLSVLAVRAACRVSWLWAGVAGVAGALCALLPLAAVAGAWAGLNS